MAQIRADEITRVLREEIENYERAVNVSETGSVISVGDGIARIHGLEKVMAGELIEFPHDVSGIALNLEEDQVGAVLLGDYTADQGRRRGPPHRPHHVRAGGRSADRPRGERARRSRSTAKVRSTQPSSIAIERLAPGVVDRQPVKEPLQTGIKAIDAMIPIGRGQRELIIGDRQTGKTAIALDTIINQKGGDVICIYVAIGQKRSTVAQVVKTLEDYGAMDYTIVVAATASDPAPMQYIAPFSGCAMGEYFRDTGRHALVHLRRSFQARRGVSRDFAAAAPSAGTRSVPGRRVLSAQPPAGARREAERANGGGSLTALPFIETQAGDVSAYIPTNVISITDGQIFLEADLFNSNVRPAINVGISVSRVGGNAQIKAMRSVAGSLASRPRAVPRAGGVRAVRLRSRQGLAAAAQSRPPPGRDSEAGAVPAAAGRKAGSDHLRRHQRRSSTIFRWSSAAGSKPSCTASSRTRIPACSQQIREKKVIDDELKAEIDERAEGIQAAVHFGRQLQAVGRMPSLIDIRRRIRSVKNTQQITKAMKMVSAAKLRRAQERVIAARPYARCCSRCWRTSRPRPPATKRVAESPLLAQRPEKRIQLVLLTADRGLAGAFNTNLIKAAQRFIDEQPGAQIELEADRPQGPRLLPPARRIRSPASTSGCLQQAGVRRCGRDRAQGHRALLQRRDRRRLPVYNEFKSVMAQKLTIDEDSAGRAARQGEPVDYIFEQPPEEMLASLLPKYVEMQILRGDARIGRRGACRAHDGHGCGHLERRRRDRQADAVHEPRAPGQHHQEKLSKSSAARPLLE